MSSANIKWDNANNTFNISAANLIANIATIENKAVFANTSTGSNAGNVTILANGAVTINNTTVANSTVDGALLVIGGIKSNNQMYARGNITSEGDFIGQGKANLQGDMITTSNSAVTYSANNIFSGALQVAGDGGIGGNLYVGGNLITTQSPSFALGNTIAPASPTKTLAGYMPIKVAGSGATASAVTVVGTSVTGITLGSGGSGYTTAPTVFISPPQAVGGVQAVATASVSGGAVTGFVITTAGSGYTSATVVISPGLGTTYYLALYS